MLKEVRKNSPTISGGEELNNLEDPLKRLKKNYQSRIKIIIEREHELQEELKTLTATEKS